MFHDDWKNKAIAAAKENIPLNCDDCMYQLAAYHIENVADNSTLKPKH